MIPGTGYNGGIFHSGTQSLSECRARCLETVDPECVAIDVSSSSVGVTLCFTHTNDSLESNQPYSNNFMEHQRLISRCRDGRYQETLRQLEGPEVLKH